MTEDVHERAARMISREKVEGLGAEERRWLNEHLSVCPGCSKDEEALRRTLSDLRSVSVELNPALVMATRRKVRGRAAALEAQRSRVRAVLLAALLSFLWMAFTGPLTWQGFQWLGRSLGWADPIWQSAFLLGWFLPATAVALILGLLQQVTGGRSWRTN
jgi:anti-sigma factor RsiW